MAESKKPRRKAHADQEEDQELRKITQPDKIPLSIGFGFVGLPSYDFATSTWSFPRLPGNYRSLNLLGPFLTHDLQEELNVRNEESRHEDTRPPYKWAARRHGNAVRTLLQDVPRLDLDNSLMQGLLQESEAVTEAQSKIFDPAFGDLLIFGRAIDARAQSAVARICAAPCEKSHRLRLTQLARNVSGWGLDESVGLELYSHDQGLAVHWQGPGVPILQVCDAEVRDGTENFIAIRLPTTVCLMRPIVGSSAQVSTSRTGNAPLSTIQPNHILTISAQVLQSPPFADVSFDPWYKRYLAVISQDGAWCIFDILGLQRHVRQTYTASIVQRGYFERTPDVEENKDTNQSRSSDDGWFKIMWICNSKTIVVCSRRELHLLNIWNNPPERLGRPNLGLDHSPDWILDIKRVPGHRDYLLMLTSTHLLLIDAGHLAEEKAEDRDSPINESNMMSWKLSRDRDDITLRMCLAKDHDGSVVTVVYSQLNLLVTNIRFEVLKASKSARSLTDPCHLDLGQVTSRKVISATIGLVDFVAASREQSTEESHEYRDNSFFQLSVLHDDYSTESFIAYSTSPSVSTETASTERIPPLDWTKNLNHPLLSEDRVEDELEEATEVLGDLGIENGDDGYSDPTPLHIPHPGSNFGKVYKEITRKKVSDGMPLLASLDRLKLSLESGDVISNKISRTLYEIIGPSAMVEDVTAASSAFDQFREIEVTNIEPEVPKYGIRPVSESKHVGLEASDSLDPDDPQGIERDITISDVYRHVTKNWIGSLPSNSPGRLRRSKEMIARRAAVEVALSSYTIRALPTQPTQSWSQVQQDVPMLSQSGFASQFTIPIRPGDKGKAPMFPRSSSRPGSSHASSAPFASQSQVQTSQSSSSRPVSQASSAPFRSLSQLRSSQSNHSPTPASSQSISSGSFSTNYLSPGPLQLNTLRQYAQVSKPPVIVSGPMSRILSHWAFGEDPAAYEYETTIRNLAAMEETELAPKARRRLERRMKKRLREERLENAYSQAAEGMGRITLSQPSPRVDHGSSPGPPYGGLPGSSQPVVASQIELGKFGARPKKKRKTRQSGF